MSAVYQFHPPTPVTLGYLASAVAGVVYLITLVLPATRRYTGEKT